MSQNLKLLEESGIQSWQNPRYPGVHHLWAVGGLNDALLPGTEMTQQETVSACCKKLTHSMRRRQSYEILRNLKFPQTHSIHFPWLFTRNQYNQHKVNLLEHRKVWAANTWPRRPHRMLLVTFCLYLWPILGSLLQQANSVIATFNVSSPTFEPDYHKCGCH